MIRARGGVHPQDWKSMTSFRLAAPGIYAKCDPFIWPVLEDFPLRCAVGYGPPLPIGT